MNSFFTTLSALKRQASAHKITTAVIVITILGTGYWGYGKLTSTVGETRYVLGTAEKGTIVVSITGSGQVSASNQVDIKPKVSGDIVYLGVAAGEEVEAGTLIAEIDPRNAEKAVRDAEVNLQSAQLALEKLRGPDSLTTPRNKTQAQEDLKQAYDDGYNTVANTFLDLPAVMSGLHDILYNGTIVTGQANADYFANAIKNYNDSAYDFRDDAYLKYQTARTAYDKNFNDYKATSRFADSASIEKLIYESYDTTKSIAEAVKSANNLIQLYQDSLKNGSRKPDPSSDTFLTSLNGYTGKTNTYLTSLLSIKNTIINDEDAISNADLDVTSQLLTVKQRQNALLDAKDALSDYYIRAPFNGTIAKVSVKKADSVSSGTAIATLITRQKIAELSLNEIDAAKIKVGDKTTLTFDAIDGLTISGKVAEIDTLGTVTQGVVSYNVKLSFDTQDPRVKPGMSVSAAIITDVKQNVLTVPSSAVKTQGGQTYVQMLDITASSTPVGTVAQGILSPTPPREQPVEIGISNDTDTEIVSGLKEGDQVVTRTIVSTAQTTTAAPSLLGSIGGTRSATGGARTQTAR